MGTPKKLRCSRYEPNLNLAGVVLHQQQLVDFQGNPFAFAATGALGAQLGFIQLQVGRDVG